MCRLNTVIRLIVKLYILANHKLPFDTQNKIMYKENENDKNLQLLNCKRIIN